MNMEIIKQLAILIVGFALLVKGADLFVDGASGIAKKFGISELIIGLTIVAMGTSAPEAAVSIAAAAKGSAGISIGNVIGSNIMNIFIILGVVAAITPLKIERSTVRYEMPFTIIVTVLFVQSGRRDLMGWPAALHRLSAAPGQTKTGRGSFTGCNSGPKNRRNRFA